MVLLFTFNSWIHVTCLCKECDSNSSYFYSPEKYPVVSISYIEVHVSPSNLKGKLNPILNSYIYLIQF